MIKGTPFHKNNIISIEKMMMTIPTIDVLMQHASSNQPSSLSMYMLKKMGEK